MATPENGKKGHARGSASRPTASRLAWLGHGTVLLDLDGVRLLTDPLLRDRVSYLRRRAARVDPADYAGVDAVLLSHLHFDHLDLPSLRMMGRGTPLVVPRGGGRLLVRDGFRRVAEMEVGQEMRIGTLTVRAVHAEHAGARSPLGPRAPALGYVISGSLRTYFAGDTGAFDGMAEIGPLHLALLPVSGWGPLAPLWDRLPVPVPGHLDPRRAAEVLRLLRPLAAVPVHWGTYAPPGMARSVAASAGGPPAGFRRHAAVLAPSVEVRILRPGEALGLGTIGEPP